MMHTARFRYESFGHNGTEGFRDELTAGGQGVGVYMHVLGNAGAKLLNPLIGNPIIGGNHIKDKIQTWLGTNRGKAQRNWRATKPELEWGSTCGITFQEPHPKSNSD